MENRWGSGEKFSNPALGTDPNSSPVAYLGLDPVKAAVLVVDDSQEMQRYLRVLLEIDSYQVETVGSGQEALEKLRRGYAPQVILLDLEMPGMDGLETLRLLQELRPHAKVIMCSGADDPCRMVEAAALGAQAFLVKPVQHLYLSAAIERCFDEDSANRGPKRSRPQVFVLPAPGQR